MLRRDLELSALSLKWRENIKRIVTFGYANLSDHWASFFYLDYLAKEGCEIVYLNVDRITLKHNDSIVNHSSFIEQIDIGSISEFEKYVKKLKEDSVFVPCLTIAPIAWNLFRILINNRAITFYLHVGEYPSSSNEFNYINFLRKAKKVFSATLVKKVLFETRKKKFLSHLRCAFTAGSLAAGFHRKNGCKKIVNINVRDFDDARKIKDIEASADAEKYCVFIDSYLPYHSDNVVSDIDIEPISYFRSMNVFFDRIEDKYGLEVIVAAHPKSQYEIIGNKYNGRKIIKGQTGKLVKDSKFVLNNESSALTHALFFNKSMVFLTTDNINNIKGWYANNYLMLANMLDCPLINVDIPAEMQKVDFNNVRVNYEKYDDFKYKYQTSKESENEWSYDIILKELKKLL